jgi:hypothetical protein
MHDDRVAFYRNLSERCVRRTKLKGRHADEWTRLANYWEMLARIREGMPNIAHRHDIEQHKIPNARRA